MLKGKSENSTYIAAGLKELRRTNTMTQADLSSKSSLTIQSISILERGVGNPVMSNLEKVANALQTSVSDLITEGKKLEMKNMHNLRTVFANNIYKQRKLKKLTQEQLAHKTGISTGHIRNVEKSRISISIDKVEALAEALGVDPDQLFRMHES